MPNATGPALLDAVDLGGPDGEVGASAYGNDVWQEGRRLWTRFPPPENYRGTEDGLFGEAMYRRTLTKAEIAALDAQGDRSEGRARVLAARRRDRFFGFREQD